MADIGWRGEFWVLPHPPSAVQTICRGQSTPTPQHIAFDCRPPHAPLGVASQRAVILSFWTPDEQADKAYRIIFSKKHAIVLVDSKKSVTFAIAFTNSVQCPDGGIGRRAGLKHQWGNPSRFDPGSGYRRHLLIFWFRGVLFLLYGQQPTELLTLYYTLK